jgi:hypothetical protein
LHCRKQDSNDKRSHPSIKEKLRAEPPQQVGHTSRQLDHIPYIGAVEEEKLKLLLIMEMVRIGQSEKE